MSQCTSKCCCSRCGLHIESKTKASLKFIVAYGPMCNSCYDAFEKETTEWVEFDIEKFGDQ